MKKISIIMLIVLLSLLSGCKMFKKPTVDKIHDIKIVSMSPDVTELLISVKVNNPNSYKLILKSLNIDLLDKSRNQIGNALMKASIMIPGRKSTAIDFTVKLDTRKTAKLISHSDQIVFFYVQGHGKGKALGFNKNFEFEEPYELNIRDYISDLLPRFTAEGKDLFKLQRTHISQLGLGETEVISEFMILNPYGMSFTFKAFPADVIINDKVVGKGSLQAPLSFDENVYSKDGVIVLKVSNFKSILGALKGVVKGEIGYQVKGTVVIDAFGMEIKKPYEYRGSIPFNLSELIF